jgi:ubiquinone/menaquinone biosynthesis C-methylase UbiE
METEVTAMGQAELVREQFNKQAHAYEKLTIVTERKLLDHIVSISGAQAGDRVIDFACDPGFVGMAFAEKGALVTGVDVADRFLEHANAEAKRRGLANISFRAGNVEALVIAPDTFDLAVCRFAFHHFGDPTKVLSEMKRVTRPGGRIVIVDMIASENQQFADYHNRVERLCDPSHARAIPASEYERMFAESRLVVVSRSRRETSYGLSEWMDHGGPSPENRAVIIAMMEASIELDRCGLKVRRGNGGIRFSHQGMSYVLQKSPEGG